MLTLKDKISILEEELKIEKERNAPFISETHAETCEQTCQTFPLSPRENNFTQTPILVIPEEPKTSFNFIFTFLILCLLPFLYLWYDATLKSNKMLRTAGLSSIILTWLDDLLMSQQEETLLLL
jgi:hypothetical protein